MTPARNESSVANRVQMRLEVCIAEDVFMVSGKHRRSANERSLFPVYHFQKVSFFGSSIAKREGMFFRDGTIHAMDIP